LLERDEYPGQPGVTEEGEDAVKLFSFWRSLATTVCIALN
jgi:hypothetical protein